MPIDVKKECLPTYQRLYEWHTQEIRRLDSELSQSTGEEQKRIRAVESRLIVERRRIRKIYPETFGEDEFDSRLANPGDQIR